MPKPRSKLVVAALLGVVFLVTALGALLVRERSRSAAWEALPPPPEAPNAAFARTADELLDAIQPWSAANAGFFQLARLYHANGFYEYALALYERSDPAEAGSGADLPYLMADAASQIGHADRAENALRTALAREPSYAAARLRLADILRKTGRPEEAAAELEALLQGEPNHPHALVALAWIREQQGATEDAKALLEKTLQLHPDFSAAAVLMAQLHASSGDAAAAARFRVRIGNGRDAPPGDPILEELWALCCDPQLLGFRFEDLIKGGEIEKAMSALDRIEELDPNGWRASYLRGLLFAQMRQPGQAAIAYQRAIAAGGSSAALYTACVKAFHEAGQLVEAERLGAEAIAADQTTPSLYLILAEIAQTRGVIARALRLAETGLAMDPSSLEINRFLGRLHWEAGAEAKAVPYLERMRALVTEDLVSRLALGEFYSGNAQPERALGPLEEAYAIAPENPNVIKLLSVACLRAGNDSAKSEQWEQGMERYGRALAVDPSLEEAHVNRIALARFRKADEALVSALIEYAHLRPRQAELWLELGDAQQRLGQKDAAEASWQAALRRLGRGESAATLRLALEQRLN